MPQLNNTRLGYYPPENKVMLYRFEIRGENKEIAEKRDISAEFLHVVRDWVSHAGVSAAPIPKAIGRFRNWVAIRILGRPDWAPRADTRWIKDDAGNKYIVSITTIPARGPKPVLVEEV